MISTSESLLLRLRTSSDFEAWSQFVDLYTPLIFTWARKTGLPSSDAADLVQEVLTIAFRKLPSFEYQPEKTFRGWLRTVTINKHREHSRRKSINAVSVRTGEMQQVPDPVSTWDLHYQQELVAQAFELIKHEFRPETWKALHEFVTTEGNAAEIGKRHGVSPWTIYGAKSRLLARLRETLDGLLE